MADYSLIEGALQRGYSMDEIADKLAQAEGLDPSVIRSRGYGAEDIIGRLGYAKPEAPKPTRNAFAYANDTAIDVANSATGLLKAGVDLVAPDSSVSESMSGFIKRGEESQSDWKKQSRADLQKKLSEANGEFDKAGIYAKHAVVNDPLGTAAQIAGNAAPFAIAGRAMQGLQAASKVIASVGLSSGLTAGEVRGNIYEKIKNTPDSVLSESSQEYMELRKRMSEDEAKSVVGSSIINNIPELAAAAIVGGLGGKYGFEGMMTGVAPKFGGRIVNGLVGVADEATQGAVEQLASNVGVRRVLPSQSLTEDVGLNAAAEGIMGVGAVAAPVRPSVAPSPSITSAPTTDGAIKAFQDEVASVTPRGSFGSMDDLTGLIESERSDLGKRRGLLAQQQQDARDMENEFNGLVKDEQIDQSYRLNDAQQQRDAERARDGGYDLALQQREEQQGRTVEQQVAASEAQGFGEQEPTAMQLAMQLAKQKALDSEFDGLLKQERTSINELRANVKKVAGVPVESISTPQLEEIAQSEAHPNTKMAAVAALNDRHDAIQQERERLMQLRETRLERQSNQPEQGAQHGAESHEADGQVATPSVAGGGIDVPGGGFDAAMVASVGGVRGTAGAGAAVSRSGQVGAVPVADQPANVRALTENAAKRQATQLTNQGYPTAAYPHPTQAGMWAIGSQDEAKAATVPAPSATQNDVPPRQSASWVIRNKETGEVVMETFDRKKVDALNTAKYEAVPIREYLEGLNKRNESTAAEPPAVEVRSPVKRKLPASNNIAQAIINMGGVSTSLKNDILGDASIKTRPGLFTTNGTGDLGEIAAMLSSGFGFSQIDLNDPTDNSGAKQLADLIARSVNGETIHNEEAMIRAQQDEEFEQAKAEVNQQAADLNIKPIRGKRTIDVVQAEINAILAEREEMTRQKQEAKRLLDEVAEQELIDAFNLQMQEYHDENAITRDDRRAESARLSAEESAQGDGDPVDQAAPSAGRASPTEGGRGEAEVTPEFGLVGQTEEEAIAAEQTRRDEEAKRQREEQDAENKRQADAERDSFNLSGIPLPADELAARGQEGLFEQKADPIAAVKATLDAAGVTGTDRTTTIAAVRRGDLTPEDVAESHPSPNVADSASEGKPIRPYATPDERNEAIWTLQAEAKSSGLEYSNESIKDAAEFGAPANEIAAAIDAGEDAVADLAERYAKRSNGLRQGFGQGNNDNALRENMKPPSEHEKRIASLTGRGLYELTEAQRSSLLKFAKVRSIDAFEDIAFSARREIIGQWLDMNPAETKQSATYTIAEHSETIDAAEKVAAAESTPTAPIARKPLNADAEAIAKADADLDAALGDLGDIIGQNFRMNFTPEQEQKIIPVLTRLFDAAFRKGYYTFKDAARFVLDTIKAKFGVDIEEQITLDHLQGAYIGMAGRYRDQGADSARVVVAVENKKELEVVNGNDQHRGSNLERDSQDANVADGMGEEGVRNERGGNRGGRGSGIQDSQGEGGPRGGVSVSGREAVSSRERGDLEIYTGAPELSPGAAGNRVDLGSRDSGLAGPPVEPDATKAIGEAATKQSELVANKAEQARADKTVPHKGGIAAIRDALPILTEGQQEDVAKAETRFAVPDGYGMLFTNGTGTGKTFTGLGVIKRLANQGKTNILVVAPNDKIIEDWQKVGKLLGLDISRLADTNDSGEGIVITTHSNIGQNNALASREWDLVVSDEAHYLAMGKDGANTNALKTLRAITLHPDGVHHRYAMLNAGDIERLKQLDESAKSDRMSDFDVRWQQAEVTQKEADKLRNELKAKQDAIKADVADRQGEKRPRALFLSATPFAYEKTVDWANGYLFDYNEGRSDEEREFRGYNAGSNLDQFMMQHFGYRMRYGKLTQPDAKVDSGLMQRQFNTWLKKKGSLSGRMLDVAADYDRRFILVDSAIGQRIDDALEWFESKRKAQRTSAMEADDRIGRADPYENALSAVRDQIGEKFDYLSRRYLLESIKAREVVPHVREHLAMGRKVVVFHDYKKGGGFNPFLLDERSVKDQEAIDATIQAAEWNRVVREFNAEFKDIIHSDLFRQSSPIDMFKAEFPGVLLFNGDVPAKTRRDNVAKFQDDASGPQVILVQSAAGKEGISLHDTTGKHQRVLFNLGQPTQPTTAIQQEGRIYRTGQKSDAIFRYLNTGTNWEKWAFATTIAQRASAAENLGMGEQARALKDAFISGFEESDDYRAGMENEGKGGKERDKAANSALTEYDRAKAFYFGTQKKNSKTKAQEGTDYFATPEPVGLKMMELADIRPGESVLEPSAGHGAIARWAPDTVEKTAIEPSMTLRPRLAMVFDGKILGQTFEELHVSNKYDAIVMNPPFGSAGRTAIDHLAKAATHLRDGGRIVALIPRGPAADAKFEKWLYEDNEKPIKPLYIDPNHGPVYKGDTLTLSGFGSLIDIVVAHVDGEEGRARYVRPAGYKDSGAVNITAITKVKPTGKRTESFSPSKGINLVANIDLPQVTFERAGTKVATRIVVLEKSENAPQQTNRDYSNATDIGDLFDRMENLSIAPRAKAISNVEHASMNTSKPVADQAAAKAGAESLGLEIVEHTTKAGKVIRGVVRRDLTLAEAKKIDEYTFKKDGGYFIREKHLAALSDGVAMFSRGRGKLRSRPRGEITHETQRLEKEINRDLARQGQETIGAAGFITRSPMPDDAHRIVKAVEKLFGVRVEFVQVEDERANIFNGVFLGGNTLFVNVDSSSPISTVIGHEFLHFLKESNHDIYAKVEKDLLALANARKFAAAAIKHQPAMNAGEEVIADTFGDQFSNPEFWEELANRLAPSLFMRVRAAFTRFLGKLLGEIKATGTTHKTDALYSDLSAVRDAVLSATVEAANGRKLATPEWRSLHARFMTAWHGSPHDHDGFSMAHIGTGEGAQAYGYGLYFAGAREVAEGYRVALTSSAAKKQFDVAAALAAAKWFKSGMVVNGTTYYSRMDLQDDIAKQNLSSMHMPDEVRQVFADKLSERNGRLYQVELAPAEDEFLDWDKPLSEQSEKVKAALQAVEKQRLVGIIEKRKQRREQLAEEGGDTAALDRQIEVLQEELDADALDLGGDGNNYYKSLSMKLGGDEAVSKYLHSLGIRGIRYLDGSSRRAGEGNSNYVIFDDADVTITAKESRRAANPDTPADAGVSVSAPSESVRRIQAVVERFKSQFKGTSALDIRVVSTTFDIPARFRPSPFAEGVFHDDAGLVYLVTMNLRNQRGDVNEGRAFQILLHECVGHFGLSQMMGEKFAGILKAVKQATSTKGRVTDETRDTFQPGDKDYATWDAVKLRYPDASDSELAQEVLARMSETDPGSSVLGYAVATVRQWVRDVARAMGVNVMVSTSELRDLVAKASGYMRRGDNLADERASSGLVAASKSVMLERDRTMSTGLESRAATVQPQGAIWSAPEPSRTDNIIYTMQDKNIDLKRVQQAIKETVGEIRDDIDAYLQEELFHGRAAKITEEFLDKEVNPLISLMRASNVSMEEMETFLWARHAKERNAQIAKINDEMPDGGSGLTNKQADELLGGKNVTIGGKTIAGVKPARKKLLADLAGRVDAITKGNRALLERYGLESAETLNAWDAAYQHYVPLHREDTDSHLAGMGTGQGYSVKGSSSKRATGSFRPVENIFANLALQRERIITRGEKNRVAQALHGLAKEMPNADLWEVDVKPTMRTTAMIGGREQVVDAVDPNFRNKPNVVFARFNGEDRFVVFNEHNERAVRMAEALKNLDADDISHLLGEVSRWTRYFASINTQYNPIFGVTNLVRDVQTGLLNLKSTPLDGKQMEMAGGLVHALPAVFKALRADRKGQSATGTWAQLWEEFQEVGGQTGYRDMFRNSHERAEALQNALDPAWWQKTWWGKAATVGGILAAPEQVFVEKVGKPFMELLSDYNTMMENGIRLSAYKLALDSGMTKERAASLAKNLTVNFNRKGQAGRQVGAMYAFFNASVQGTARMAETLNHGAKPGELLGKAGKQIIYGGLMLGALQAMLLLAAGFDDEEPPEFVRDRNIIIPTGNGKYISIPLPLGFHVLPTIGRISIEFTAGGFKKPGEHLVHIMDVLLDSFNPIGNAGLSMQTLAPTVLDPVAALTENKDWSGRQIARQDFSKLNPTPGYTRAKDTASSLSRGLAYALNYLSGGGEYGIGIVSPTPDQIEYLIGQVTGGVGRELGKVATTGEAIGTGEDLPPHKIPLVGRFYGDTMGQSSEASKFYGTLEKLAEHKGALDRMKDAHASEAYQDYLRKHPESRLYGRAASVQREVANLRKLKRQLLDRGADRAKIRQVEDRMKAVMARFNQSASEHIRNQQ